MASKTVCVLLVEGGGREIEGGRLVRPHLAGGGRSKQERRPRSILCDSDFHVLDGQDDILPVCACCGALWRRISTQQSCSRRKQK